MFSNDGVRAAVDTVGREMALLGERTTAGNGKDLDALRTSWATLLEALALGPAPELRKCPHCGGIGMRAATLCGTCWKRLVPPPAASDGHWGGST
jgi:hypothetical protein